ncbi:voltage-dependent calcium channel subunit alpha-2/delta-3-like [Harmonia axyridis]|uniref:voltage-dependent calcium channel subunit alpha-2/delta-3-like n=1 Tax=Harmonia axyridis TaxID=115357 RepID=UPI001E278032|nr:voltage-dependent calcium channel subunit alpha-2/delta-3-like [Harmonia axyridis]
MLLYLLLHLAYFSVEVRCDRRNQEVVIEQVKFWSDEIGKELKKLSEKMTRKTIVKESFSRLKNQLYREDGDLLTEKIAADLRTLMNQKENSTKRIAEFAEYLSVHRKKDQLFPNGTYHYFNADNFTEPGSTTPSTSMDMDLQNYMKKLECKWWCHLNNVSDEKTTIDEIFRAKKESVLPECDCDFSAALEESMHWTFYKNMSMKYNSHFETEVNMNFSIIKTALNVYDREQDILEGARWTEPLDMIFKENIEEDPTLTWQYFTSPSGYMRHYPAVKWSTETYDQTYDMRTRSWYTEAMTSPKDIVILLDNSGSAWEGIKMNLGAMLVNNILDTLNDNDFVNIFVFNNTTRSLVPCFDDTLVQANEENLRLLRESLSVYTIEYAADIKIGYTKAFKILERYRANRGGSRCNQAIMIITEQLDYDYHPEVLRKLNYNKEVRIFTYLLGTSQRDRIVMEDIACENMGYYANITLLQEVREKMLKYIPVMSRPINYNNDDKQNPIWSYLYVDLADRRICNWLWRKREGIRQREIFLDHVKRLYRRTKKILTSENFHLLKDSHEYEEYETPRKNFFMTTVSLPVYDRRPGAADLIGVAAVDVPIKLIKSLIPHHKLGVNGYAFVVTNNGYILMHPDHRPTFGEDKILKPTFNRVDLLEVEILDDQNEPRLFAKSVVQMREKVVYEGHGKSFLKVKFALDDLKRIILTERNYYYTDIRPFGFAIVLPDKYGNIKIDDSKVTFKYARSLLDSKNWKVHPLWKYCRNCGHGSPEAKILECMRRGNKCHYEELFKSLLQDANITEWFDEPILNERIFVDNFYVSKIFIATRSGLTRWRTYTKNEDEDETNDFELLYPNSIDEEWYRRAVEENYKNEEMFIYSVPFEISGYENNTMITGTTAIFVGDGIKKTPVATIGLQFNHRTMYNIYNNITTRCKNRRCNLTCESDYLSCFILDNNAYVVLSDNREHTGRYIGDLRPDIMYHLVKNEVYRPTRMFDYQGICYKDPLEEDHETTADKKKRLKRQKKNSAPKVQSILGNLIEATKWALSTIALLAENVIGANPPQNYKSIKKETIAYEKLLINKTIPTPCDKEMWLFTLGNDFVSSPIITNRHSKFDCLWPYVVNKIAGSNLLFLAINLNCKVDTVLTYKKSPQPIEIIYANNTAIRQNTALPCYIANKNNYSRHIYTKCYRRDRNEEFINKNRLYCGHFWEGP